jgi:large subunit ribosomal protein L30
MADKTLRATLMKSSIGARPEIKATVESLGFRKMNQTRELPDNGGRALGAAETQQVQDLARALDQETPKGSLITCSSTT